MTRTRKPNPLGAVDLKPIRDGLQITYQPLHAVRSGGQEHWRETGDIVGLGKAIDTDGQRHPIVVRPDGVIIDGWRRHLAIQRLDASRHIATVIVSDLAEAVAALGIADGDHREPLPFRARMMTAALINAMPLTRDREQFPRIKAETAAAAFGATHSCFYHYMALRRWADDDTLPGPVRMKATQAVDVMEANDGRNYSTLYQDALSAVRNARADTSTPPWSPSGLPRHLERVARTALDVASLAHTLATIPASQFDDLPDDARAELHALLGQTVRDITRTRQILGGHRKTKETTS